MYDLIEQEGSFAVLDAGKVVHVAHTHAEAWQWIDRPR